MNTKKIFSFENIIKVAFIGLALFGLLTTIFGIPHTLLTDAAKTATPGDHFFGTLTLIATILVVISGVLDLQFSEKFQISVQARWIAIGFLYGLTIFAFCGFFAGSYK